MINYQKHDADGFVRDAEFYGKRGDANYRFWAAPTCPGPIRRRQHVPRGPQCNGEVLIQSYNRPWLGSPPPQHRRWRCRSTPTLAALLVSSELPSANSDGGGHVKNLDFGPGVPIPGTTPQQYYSNDSILIDAGFPVMTAPNGKRFRPLFASVIIDLDGKVNLNATGNIRSGNGGGHASTNGLGPWDINPSQGF